MKLAEFFVALGFDIEGAPELKSLKNSLDDLQGAATKLLAIFGGMTAGMAVMLNQALRTSDGLRRFVAVTGLSTDELKRWQYAAEVAGVEGKELTSVIENLQQARTDIMMGKGNVAPWQLLGIAPDENPFETLRALKARIKDLDPAIARNIASQMGISEGVFAMLRLSNKEFDELEKKYALTREQQKNLTETNRAWADLTFKIAAVRDSIVSALVPALSTLLRSASKVVGVLASFASWLSKDTMGAKIMRVVLVTLAAAIVAITGALTVLVGVIGLVIAATIAWEAAASPILPVLWALAAVVLVVTAMIVALVLVVQDLWTALTGGESAIERVFVKPFRDAGLILNGYIADLMKLLGIYEAVNKAAEWLYMKSTGMKTGFNDEELKHMEEVNRKYKEWLANGMPQPAEQLTNAALIPANATSQTSSIKQENNVDIHVDGGKDPYQTGQIIGDKLKQAISNAAYQLPVPA